MSVIFNNSFQIIDDEESNIFSSKVTIASQKRNGKKRVTLLYGLETNLDLKKMLKYFKKNFNCNGTIENDSEFGEVIQVSGDQKNNIFEFLVKEDICNSENIIIKGD